LNPTVFCFTLFGLLKNGREKEEKQKHTKAGTHIEQASRKSICATLWRVWVARPWE
jgi:hypothetical protein